MFLRLRWSASIKRNRPRFRPRWELLTAACPTEWRARAGTEELPRHRFRQFPKQHGVGRKSVIAQDLAVLVHRHKRCGDHSFGVLSGLLVEIIVEIRDARMERRPILSGEPFYVVGEVGRTTHRNPIFLR